MLRCGAWRPPPLASTRHSSRQSRYARSSSRAAAFLGRHEPSGSGDPVAELLALHNVQEAPLRHLSTPEPAPSQRQRRRPATPRTVSPEKQLARITKFKGLVNDPLRPHQRGIILHLLFSPDVPEAARRIYHTMKANTLQETIRARVKAQQELSRCLVAASHQHTMLVRWHRIALDKQPLNPAALKQEEAIILRIKTRLGGARSKVQQLMALARNMADTEYSEYAAQHLGTADALEAWLEECRRVYYPWMRRMLRVNADYARRVAIMGECAEVERRWLDDVRRVPELTFREVPVLDYETRYPRQGTVTPRLEEEQLLQRIKLEHEDPEYVVEPLLQRAPAWAAPGMQELHDPTALVLPSTFE